MDSFYIGRSRFKGVRLDPWRQQQVHLNLVSADVSCEIIKRKQGSFDLDFFLTLRPIFIAVTGLKEQEGRNGN
jgi:hypothetical protein